jgi:uncharacterized protein (TIGR02001 family)
MFRSSFIRFFFAGFLFLGSAPPVLAASPNFSYELSLVTDYVFRGVSQTLSDPALQASVSMDTDSGCYGCLWMSNIDYAEAPQPDDGARTEIDLFIGYQRPINERLAADFALARYMMPGTDAGIDYNYNEWIASLYLDDRHAVSVAYASDVFGSGAAGWHYLASTSFDLPQEFSLHFTLGSVDLRDAYGESYQYAGASLLRTFGLFSTRLDYWTTSSDAKRLFDEAVVRPRLALAIAVNFD